MVTKCLSITTGWNQCNKLIFPLSARRPWQERVRHLLDPARQDLLRLGGGGGAGAGQPPAGAQEVPQALRHRRHAHALRLLLLHRHAPQLLERRLRHVPLKDAGINSMKTFLA